MAGNNIPKNNKAPKFSIYWIYAIIAVVILGSQFVQLDNNYQETDPIKFFNTYVANGHV